MTFLTFTIIDEKQKVQLEEKEKTICKLEENSKGIYTSNRKRLFLNFKYNIANGFDTKMKIYIV